MCYVCEDILRYLTEGRPTLIVDYAIPGARVLDNTAPTFLTLMLGLALSHHDDYFVKLNSCVIGNLAKETGQLTSWSTESLESKKARIIHPKKNRRERPFPVKESFPVPTQSPMF